MKRITAILLCLAMVMCLAACGTAHETQAQNNVNSENNAIKVSTIDEFLEAIAPGANIELAEGTYDLTKARGFGGKNVSDYYCWASMGDAAQYALEIEDVDNLTISGKDALIVTSNRWSTVLTFRHCDGLNISGLSIGHTEQVEGCEGGVLSLNSCDDSTVASCDLYGCGTVGVEANDCYNLSVTDTEIHHCSSSAVCLSSGKNIEIRNCNIHDCGTNYEMHAWTIFSIYDSRAVSISDCTVSNNHSDSLFSGYSGADALKVDNISVKDNLFSYVLSCNGRVELNNPEISGNTINSWCDRYSTAETVIDGKTVTLTEIDDKFGEQLSINGTGSANPVALEIDKTGTKEIHVETADEFLNAIAPDTTVIIDAPIDLTTASSYGENTIDEYWGGWEPLPEGRTYAWQQVFDGYTLWISNVSNFHIEGGEIITQPRYANVLGFTGCSGISIFGTTAGHSPEQGECMGGVLVLNGCSNVIIESCNLYGCGIYGLQTNSCSVVNLQNTYIHDCTYGAAQFFYTDNVTCIGNSITSCPSPEISIDTCADFIWEDKYMPDYCDFDPVFG